MIKTHIIYLSCLLACFKCIEGVKKPSYIPSCRRNDPKLNECALKNARVAIPYIAQGDSVVQIPTMTPLHVNQINVQPSHHLQLNLTNLNIWGLPDADVTSVKVDIKNKNMEVAVSVPKLTLISGYTIKGSLQILPIEGDGPANITFDNVQLIYNFHWELRARKSVEYMIVTNHSLGFLSDRGYYHLEHLFNGNKQLGDAMTKFMDENWMAVHKDLSPLIGDAIDTIVTSIVYNILRKVPYDEIFLPG